MHKTPLSDLASHLKLSKYVYPNGAHADGNTFRNVSYYSDSGLCRPTFVNCQLDNVSFIQCKFRDTEFRNLKLKNVAFLYIDLDNVTVSDLNLEGHLWKTAIVRNAWLMGPATQSASSQPVKTLLEPFNPLESPYPLSRYGAESSTIVETLRLDSPSSKVARCFRRFENTFPASLQVPLRPQHGLLARLVDHKHIVSRIVQNYVGQKDNISKRLDRIVTMRYSSPSPTEILQVHVFCPESTLSVCLAFFMLLHASMTRPTMINDRLHGPLDCMHCTVRAPDYLRNLREDATVVLHYQLENCCRPIGTDDESWHSLMNHIRHRASTIPAIHLKIGKLFWDFAHWEDGVQEVIYQRSLRNDSSKREHPNFLKEIAKVAAPADRYCRGYENLYAKHERVPDGPNHCDRGTLLQITIDGADSVEKMTFVRELADRIECMRKSRALFFREEWYTRTDSEHDQYRRKPW